LTLVDVAAGVLVVAGHCLAGLVVARIFYGRAFDACPVFDVARRGFGSRLVSAITNRLATDAGVRTRVANGRRGILAMSIFGALDARTVEAAWAAATGSTCLIVDAFDANVLVLEVLVGGRRLGRAWSQVRNASVAGFGYQRGAKWEGGGTAIVRTQHASCALLFDALSAASATAVFRELAMRGFGASYATRTARLFDADWRFCRAMARIFYRTRLTHVSATRRGFRRVCAIGVDLTRHAGGHAGNRRAEGRRAVTTFIGVRVASDASIVEANAIVAVF
jgi:hypothetical protein